MRNLSLALAAALFVASCSKCGEAPKVTESQRSVGVGDASIDLLPGQKQAAAVAVDLKTAIVTTVPEFRGIRNLVAIAVLEEVLLDDPSDGGNLAAALEPEFPSRRFKPAASDAGALIAQNKPFFAEAERVNGHPVVRVGLVIPGEQFPDVLQTPAPMTSEQLATLLPVPAGTHFLQDTFIFEAHYSADPQTSTMLLRQLVDSHLKAGWASESAPRELLTQDAGTLNENFSAVLKDPVRGGTLVIGRIGQRVTVTWEQPLLKK